MISGAAAQGVAPCRTDGAGIALTISGARDETDQARAAFLRSELHTLGLAAAPGAPCAIALVLEQNAATPAAATSRAVQSYSIMRDGLAVRVAAASSLGLLYGFYDILDQLGVRFYAPQFTVKPARIAAEAIFARADHAPRMAQRGYWVFGDNRDAEFLLWAGRNRFNLVGGDFAGGDDHRRIFAIARWQGGHDVISRLTPTDRPVKGVMLAQRHPHWFAGATAIPHGSDFYRNPCLGDDGYIDFLIGELADALARGHLRGTALLNLWPADSPALALPSHCRRAPDSAGDADDLIYFYRRVVNAVANDPRFAALEAKPVIAGISYEASYDLKKGRQFLPAASGQPYLHIFYQSLRSFSTEFFDSASALNRQLAELFSQTVAHHGLREFGIVEYHNYSLFNGLFVPDLALLARDVEAYAARGATLYAMMHPGKTPSVAEMLMNRAMARLTFDGGEAAALQADFAATALGGSADAAAALARYTQALKSRSELFGAEFSLNLVLNADYAWSPPPIGAGEMRAAIDAFLTGGDLRLKPLRIAFLAPQAAKVESIAAVQAALDDSAALARQAAARGGGAMAEKLAQEIERARAIVAHLHSVAQARLAGLSGQKAACLAMIAPMQAQLAALDGMEWPEYVSAFQMKSRYIKTQRALLDFLVEKGCAAGG